MHSLFVIASSVNKYTNLEFFIIKKAVVKQYLIQYISSFLLETVFLNRKSDWYIVSVLFCNNLLNRYFTSGTYPIVAFNNYLDALISSSCIELLVAIAPDLLM
jgi:hypothetical protein